VWCGIVAVKLETTIWRAECFGNFEVNLETKTCEADCYEEVVVKVEATP
jgi:hypothetical protein